MADAAIEPFRFLRGRRRDLLLLCDHASNAIPAEFGELGLDAADRRRHVAWDIGAAAVTEALAALLDAPAFLGGVSRLVADLNRHPDAPDLVLDVSEATPVPGNAGIGELERGRRLIRWHVPYHHAIDRYLTTQLREGERPALLAIHSFTPVYHGRARPWPVGLLWQQRSPWLDALFEALRAEGGPVGDNQPYDGSVLMGHTLERHGKARGLRHLLVELRQDEVADASGQQAWARRLAAALPASGFIQRIG